MIVPGVGCYLQYNNVDKYFDSWLVLKRKIFQGMPAMVNSVAFLGL